MQKGEKMDIIEKALVKELDLPIYENYKKLHTEEKARKWIFQDSIEKQYEYGFSNLTTLYRLSDSNRQLILLKKWPKQETSKDLAEFFIRVSATLTGFFLSLGAVFDSVAQEINILFNNGSIDDRNTYFTSRYFKTIKTLPSKLKGTIDNIINKEKWFDEINEYRNRLAHRSILPQSLKDIYPLRVSLLRADLPFKKTINVHLKKTEYKISDLCPHGDDISTQCDFYFKKTKEAIKEIWEILYEHLKEKTL